jgi:hypothetical protein
MNPTDQTNERFAIAPLVWERVSGTSWRANSLFGQLNIWRINGSYRIDADGRNRGSLEAAKGAYCQWYRERLLPALQA